MTHPSVAENFTLGGDAGAIRGSALVWQSFGEDARSARAELGGLALADFSGDEAQLYQDRVASGMLSQLDSTHQAWRQIGTALQTYSAHLEDLQQRMSALQIRAGHQREEATTASALAGRAQADDRAAALQHTQLVASLEDGAAVPAATHLSRTGPAQQRLTEANGALRATEADAGAVRTEHQEAVRRCCDAIDGAAALRFTAPPGFFESIGNGLTDLWNGACEWMASEAGQDFLAGMSGVLGIVAAVAGLLAFIPVLTPIMAPIALAAGGLALLTDVVAMGASGDWDVAQLAIGALGLIPGVRQVVGIVRASTAATRITAATASVANAGSQATSVAARTDTVGDLVWDTVEYGAEVATVALTAHQVEQGEAGWDDLILSGLGVSPLGMLNVPRAERFWDIGTSAAAAGMYGATLAQAVIRGDEVDLGDVAGLISSAGGAVANSGVQGRYWDGGTNPDGSRTAPGNAPQWTVRDVLYPNTRADAGTGGTSAADAAPTVTTSSAAPDRTSPTGPSSSVPPLSPTAQQALANPPDLTLDPAVAGIIDRPPTF